VTAQQSAAEDVDRGTLHAARSARLRERLAAAPFDALLLTGGEAVDYATGYRSVAGQLHRGYTLAAVVTADRTVRVAPAADAGPARDGGIAADDVIPFGRFYFEGDAPAAGMSDRNAGFGPAVAAALQPLAGRRLGVEGLVQLPEAARQAVGEALAGTAGDRVTGADGWMLGVRSVKLPVEQQLLRRAAELAEHGMQAALAAAAPGITERELASAVATAMVAGGGDPRFVVATVGARTALADAFPDDTPCRPGDLIRLDVGCQVQGYWSDIARTAVLGEASALQRSRYDALLAGLYAELEVARPGATAGSVFDAAVRTVQQHGLAPYRRHHAGHAIGLSVYEEPVVRPGEATELRPGMVFCLETPYYQIGWGGMLVEDTGVVTDGGFELFTGMDRSLREVGR
jgi:Xaa-Pro aminopeptidase